MEEKAVSRKTLAKMRIQSDPYRLPVEKETCLNLLGTEKAFSVLTYHPAVVRGLLRQPEFEVTRAFTERIRGQEVVIGVEGRLSVACVHIGSPRKRRCLSTIFARRSKLKRVGLSAPETQNPPPELNLRRPSQRGKPLENERQ